MDSGNFCSKVFSITFVSTGVTVTGWMHTAEGTEATFTGLRGQAALSAPSFPSVR